MIGPPIIDEEPRSWSEQNLEKKGPMLDPVQAFGVKFGVQARCSVQTSRGLVYGGQMTIQTYIVMLSSWYIAGYLLSSDGR